MDNMEMTPHDEAQEVENAVFNGAVAILASLGLPEEMVTLITSWYVMTELTEENMVENETETETENCTCGGECACHKTDGEDSPMEMEVKTSENKKNVLTHTTKSFNAEIINKKAAINDSSGEITAIVSVFGNPDLVGDIVMPGAFQKSLQDITDSGNSIPFIWSHQWNEPEAYIGKIVSAAETEKGLEVTAKFYDTVTAQHIRQLLVDGVVSQFSFAYDVIQEQKNADGYNELVELKILEVGPTLKGCNPLTEVVSAKSVNAKLKAGRTISSRNEEMLVKANELLSDVLNSISPDAKPEESLDVVKSESGLDVKTALALVDVELASIN